MHNISLSVPLATMLLVSLSPTRQWFLLPLCTHCIYTPTLWLPNVRDVEMHLALAFSFFFISSSFRVRSLFINNVVIATYVLYYG